MTDEALMASLVQRIEVLEAEADIRRIQARYMFLCDTPNPEFGVGDDSHRIDLIMELYSEDAVWEGVGEYYDHQFGRAEGQAEIRRHFEGFWGRKQDPALLLNAHYLTSEQIHVDGDEASGQWIHMQPWRSMEDRTNTHRERLHRPPPAGELRRELPFDVGTDRP
ncbi:nuclear transport factor 2 family protein [Streptomyces viridochromogenes]|uniref:nuclear transport factor 2 family protein n=1 Tax=Streptomyces viridochromogenes TaxID=1938 RepID=UPI000B0F5792|nr:nuclear transport factor 2 family protein [Streptomyces viridochromogenes]